MAEFKEKPQIKLPFAGGKTDAGEWAYDNRRGLLVTLIVAVTLVMSALYVTISIENTVPLHSILIEIEEQSEQIKELEKQNKELQKIDYSTVENLSSNENAQELNPELKDDRHSSAQDIYREVEQMEQKAKLNREKYKKGLAEDAAISASKNSSTIQSVKSDVKIKGSVTVSFSFLNPVRNSRNLTVPAYMCQGGGRVIVDAVLNRSGKVIEASINRSTSSSADNCMRETAIKAAKSSTFNLDSRAPESQQGQITYIFIPQ